LTVAGDRRVGGKAFTWLPQGVRQSCLLLAVGMAGAGVAVGVLQDPRFVSAATLVANGEVIAINRRFSQSPTGAAGLELVLASDEELEVSSVTTLNYLQSRAFSARLLRSTPEMLQAIASHIGHAAAVTQARNGDDGVDFLAACDYFEQVVRHAYRDEDSGLVHLTVTWVDPEQAARWANAIIADLNSYLLEFQLRAIDSRLGAIRAQMAHAPDLQTADTLSVSLQGQLARRSVIASKADFAFRVIDPALPENPQRRRALYLAVHAMVGFGFGLLIGLLTCALYFCRAAGRWIEPSGAGH
jgi:uncharacterized protein involved in exopolysaccharide biosynthesis